MAKRRVRSVKLELVKKSREAALSAVQVFNNPLVQFKSETFIVLMVIAWTYLLHAFYRQQGVDYRYTRRQGRRRVFERTGRTSFKYWDLSKCIDHPDCPLDRDTKNNLRFLLPLRHEIEHQMTMNLDNYLSGRYQACVLNYCHYVKQFFGPKYAMEPYLSFSIQFLELSRAQVEGIPVEDEIPAGIRAYITDFDNSLTSDEYQNPRFSVRLVFTRLLVNRPGQADRAIQFVDPNSELGKQMENQLWIMKEVERRKYLPGDVVNMMRAEGYSMFGMGQHTKLWQTLKAKNPSKGYGTQVANTWYWYDSWISEVRKHCEEQADNYR